MTKRIGMEFIVNEDHTLTLYQNEYEVSRIPLTSRNIKCTFKDRPLSVSFNEIDGVEVLTLFNSHSMLDYWAIKGEPVLYAPLPVKAPSFVCCTEDTLMRFKCGRQLPMCHCPKIGNIISLEANAHHIIISDGITQITYSHDLTVLSQRRYEGAIKVFPLDEDEFICMKDDGIERFSESNDRIEVYERMVEFDLIQISPNEQYMLLNECGRIYIRSTRDFSIVEEVCGATNNMGFLGNDYIIILTERHSCIKDWRSKKCVWSSKLQFEQFCGDLRENAILFGKEISLEKRIIRETSSKFNATETNENCECWLSIADNFYVAVDWDNLDLLKYKDIACDWPSCEDYSIVMTKNSYYVKNANQTWSAIQNVEDILELSKIDHKFFCLNDRNFAAMRFGNEWIVFNNRMDFVLKSNLDLKRVMKKMFCPVVFNKVDHLLLELKKNQLIKRQQDFMNLIKELIVTKNLSVHQQLEQTQEEIKNLEKQLQTSHFQVEKNIVQKNKAHYKPKNLVNQPRKHGHLTYRPNQ
eukprot:TRINITY_DN11585_c0_g1_i1.p1 TRINITY_DN11585_c0_g1~~TRINITY_DN11585_c0_g1_i1.p1  ORF type:complete len:524 (+),score=110.96 TRINITY_DN11585_c0_g1_i1:215-1786(+)